MVELSHPQLIGIIVVTSFMGEGVYSTIGLWYRYESVFIVLLGFNAKIKSSPHPVVTHNDLNEESQLKIFAISADAVAKRVSCAHGMLWRDA